jgi:glycosyltransferase involved in cell wall biosynthesis
MQANQPLSVTSFANENLQERIRLSDVKTTIWLTRPDIRELVENDYEHFEWWLLLNGAREYTGLAEMDMTVSTKLLNEPAPEALPQVSPPLTRLMKAVWIMRPDLQNFFDLKTSEGQENFVWWYFIHGARELDVDRFLTDEQRAQINQPDPQLTSTSFLPITRLMIAVRQSRPDLQKAFNLTTHEGQESFLGWFFIRGMVELKLAQTVDLSQARVLLSSTSQAPQEARILSLLRAVDQRLQQLFPDYLDAQFRRWAQSEEGLEAYPILRRLRELAGRQKPVKPSVYRAPKDLPFGVNLIGYAKGQFGIGEDVRMAALACATVGIPFSIYNVEPGREVCQGDESVTSHVSDALPYSINIFCTTGIETARLAAVNGSKLFDGRYSIGYWPWELPEWPVEWYHAYNLVDEVWGSSRFNYDAFVKSCPKPVRHMPMAVTVDHTAGLGRIDFDLPQDRFLFVFSFDFLSSLARKNPQACVAAFRLAFPNGDEPVGLVVKAMRGTADNPLWQDLQAAAQTDGRISIINETLDRGALLDLYRACDCYASLHRSEGFGRGMAEAMMLGKPVIATAYSGNIDFTNAETSGLVKFVMRRLKGGEYPFGDHSVWAEPNVEHAAYWMCKIVQNHKMRKNMAIVGQRYVKHKYSPDLIGKMYRQTLEYVVT